MTMLGRRRWQFTSRALMLLMLLISPALAYIGKIKYDAAQFRRALEKARPDYDLQITIDPPSQTTFKKAVQSLIDRDAYSAVYKLNWNGDHHVGPDIVPVIAKLGGVHELRFSKHDWRGRDAVPSKVFWTDNELAQIASIPSLESISIDGVFSTSAVDRLFDLPLYQLLLPDTPLDPPLAKQMLRCQTLNSVGFDFRNTPKAAIESLARLPRLSHLTVRYAPAGKDLYAGLSDCRKLKAVLIYDSALAEEDGKALSRLKLMQVQLIDCQIAPGFFNPFGGESAWPSITIYSNRKFETYWSHAQTIGLMEERFTTRPKSAAVEALPVSQNPARPE